MNRKTAIAITTAILAVLIGAFVAQYYTWTVQQTIEPLTQTITLTLDATTGATQGSRACVFDDAVTVVQNGELHIIVKKSDVNALADAFYDLSLTIEVYDQEGNLVGKVFDGVMLIDDGTPIAEDLDGATALPEAGTYDIVIIVQYWTGAVADSVTCELPLYVYFVETVE